METLKLKIPGMKSLHCQMTVSSAITSLGGKIKNLAPAVADIEIPGGVKADEIIREIEKHGYNVSNT